MSSNSIGDAEDDTHSTFSENSIGDEEDDTDTAFSETGIVSKSTVKVDEESGGFWGDMSKYTNEDFAPQVCRLKVPKRVSFLKRTSLKSRTFLAKLRIQNISNLPITYNVQTSSPEKFKITPNHDWIPPRSEALVEIRIRNGFAQDASKVRDIVSECFTIFATPIFRKEHTTQKGKLELFWRAFGSHLLPYYHAEHYVVTVNILPTKGFTQGNSFNMSNFSMLDFVAWGAIDLEKKVLKSWKEIPDEMFRSIFTLGEDEKENKFEIEFRLRELQRVIRRCEFYAETQRKQIKILPALALLMFCIAAFAMSTGHFNLK